MLSAQCATLQKYFSYPSLVIDLFPTSPIKLKLGLQIGGEAANGKAPQPMTMIRQSQTWSTVRSYLLHSLRQVLGFAVLFTSLRTLCKIPGPKPFF